jgi:hypothetical protein
MTSAPRQVGRTNPHFVRACDRSRSKASSATAALIDEGTSTPSWYTYVFISDRLEGCAPLTIQALVDANPTR